MNLCIDVGNTTIGVGLFKEDQLIKKLSFAVDLKRTDDEYRSVINRTLKDFDIGAKDVNGIILSSVVPSISDPLSRAIKSVFSCEVMTIAPGIKTGLTVHVDNPSEIGNDLIADMVGVKAKYGYPSLIVDLGTASKVLLIDRTGTFVSCVIMPGLSLSLNSLTTKAALLSEVALKTPRGIMAKNTGDAINAGMIYGHTDMILGIIKRYEDELGYICHHILTGGGAIYVKDLFKGDWKYDSDVCLEGLNVIYRKNEGKQLWKRRNL